MALQMAIGFLLRAADRNVMDKLGRLIAVAVLLGGLAPLGGCRICADCEDLAYPAYGGAWQRTRRDAGRVGSIFDPAGAQSSELVGRDQPQTPDVLERERMRTQGGFIAPDRSGDDTGDTTEPDSSGDPSIDLRDRQLDDIENEKEEGLRSKKLEDIDVRLTPRRSRTVSVRE